MKRGSFVRSQFHFLSPFLPLDRKGFPISDFYEKLHVWCDLFLHGDEFAFAVSSMLATKEKWACVVFAVFDTLPFFYLCSFTHLCFLCVVCCCIFFAASDYFCRLKLIYPCEWFSDVCNLVREGDGWHMKGISGK